MEIVLAVNFRSQSQAIMCTRSNHPSFIVVSNHVNWSIVIELGLNHTVSHITGSFKSYAF